MKRFKLSVALLSSGLMAFSPVTQAAMNAQDKKAFNAHVRDVTKLTYGDLIGQYGSLLDATTQSQLPTWLANFGDRKLPQVQAQMVKDRKGKEIIKLVYNDMGQTFVMNIDPDNNKTVEVNGTRFARHELLDIPTAIKKMAETNKKIKDVADNTPVDRAPASQNEQILSFESFRKLKPIQRVEVLVKMNLAAEAADEAIRAVEMGSKNEAKKTSQFFLHPLVASQLAHAAVTTSTSCVVAGNISKYAENKTKRIACNPFTPEAKAMNDRCLENSSGTMVACNPLVYGFQSGTRSGIPFCIDSANQPDFTRYATQQCNSKRPLVDPNAKGKQTKEQKEAYLRKVYREILESYAVGKGNQSATEMAACFEDDTNKVKMGSKCEALFKKHIAEFRELQKQADVVCKDVEKRIKSNDVTPDQKLACDELRSRTLDMDLSILGMEPEPDDFLLDNNCRLAGGTYDPSKPDAAGRIPCKCKDGSNVYARGKVFPKCPEKTEPAVVPVIDKSTWATKEKKEDKGLCPGGWMFACVGVGLFALWKLFDHGDPNPLTPRPVITLPPTNCVQNGTCPPVTFPPVVTPKPESDNGQPGSPNNGGTRSSPSGGTK